MKTSPGSQTTARMACLGLTVLAAASARATVGDFDYGYGVQSKGIGGAGVAFPQDSLATAANPAGAAFLDNRLDVGVSVLQPDLSATAANGVKYTGNGIQNSYIPEFGCKHSLATHWDFDLAVFGNGGMTTDYSWAIPGFGSPHIGVELEQVFVTPTLAYKINSNHAFGISPIFALQRFKAYGLQNIGVQDTDFDYSYGAGVRVGYTGRLTDWLSVGATYQSRTYMTRFDKYAGLFAEQGSFDIPSNYAAGIALTPVKPITFALDVERIQFSEVRSVGNQLSFTQLGAEDGPGFGWRDVTVLKTGIAYDVLPNLTLRVGNSYNTQPIPDNQTYLNVLAPGVIQDHVTAGFTWRFARDFEVSAYFAHAFEQAVKGSGSRYGPGTNFDLRMSQNNFGVSLAWLL